MLRYSSEEVGESGGSSREPGLYVPKLHCHKPQNSCLQLSINVRKAVHQDNGWAQAFNESQDDHRDSTGYTQHRTIANELTNPKHEDVLRLRSAVHIHYPFRARLAWLWSHTFAPLPSSQAYRVAGGHPTQIQIIPRRAM